MAKDPPRKDGLPTLWAPLSQRPASARLHSLLARAAAALPDAPHPDQQRERQVERKVVGITLEAELRSVATRVGAGLGLHQDAVRLCARLLEASGELPRAANLLADADMHALAADAAERAGEIEVLERSLAALHGAEGRAMAAQVAYMRYETAVAQGLWSAALHALGQAQAARPDNPVYGELAAALLTRRPGASLVLTSPSRWRVLARAPAWLGRGEDAPVRLAVPGLSRRHAEIRHHQGRWLLQDKRGEVLWAAAAGEGVPGPVAQVGLGRAQVGVQDRGGGLWLGLDGGQADALVVAPNSWAVWDTPGHVRVALSWPEGGFPVLRMEAGRGAVRGGKWPRDGAELAAGDTVELAGTVWTVGAAR